MIPAPEYQDKTSDDELKKIPHTTMILEPEIQSPTKTQTRTLVVSGRGLLGKQTC